MKSIALALFFGLALTGAAGALQLDRRRPRRRPGSIRVAAGGDLQAALDRANAGDVIELASGATFVGNFVLPAKSGTRYTILRTAATPGLPDADGRIDPVTQREARAGFSLRTRRRRFAPPPAAITGGSCCSSSDRTAAPAGDILVLGDGSAAQSTPPGLPHDFVVDRCYIHGDPARGQKRGIAMNGASIISSGSYISDIKSTSQDAQAIAGWSGPGPFQHREQLPGSLGRELHARRGARPAPPA